MSIVRDLRDHWAFRTRLHARLGWEIFAACGGLALIAFGGTGLADIAGALLSVAAAWLLFGDIREKVRRSQNVKLKPNPDFERKIEAAAAPDGFTYIATPAGRYLMSVEVNAVLEASSNTITWADAAYKVPAQFVEYSALAVKKKKPSNNEGKIRLLTDITATRLRSRNAIPLQATNYFNGVITNETAADQFQALKTKRDGRAQVLFRPVDLMISEGRIQD